MTNNDGAYGPDDLDGWDPGTQLGAPGAYPFTRGPYPSMYRGRLWTMRQYAGFGNAASTNQRFRSLLDAGQTGLSVAFDLPTQMGLDSDDPLSVGEVGKVGVAIDSVDDMRILFDQIPLGEVSTSMTINSTASVLLLAYQIVAEEQGADAASLRGTIQNDILKEYIARGTYIYPAEPSMRIITDIFAYCADEMESWNTISISGYHIREAGSTAAQEVAFTIANGLAYVEAARAAGLDVEEFAPRLSFFWNAHNDLFEEACKFRAARRLWARLMRERVGATSPAAWKMRFHTQTAGSTLTAQQPINNVVRTAYQALAAVLGGTQSLHTNSYDEALGLPTDESVLIALRTQQILGYESGVSGVVDPLAGSYYIESLTDRIEADAVSLIHRIDELGGAVRAIEEGFPQREIEEAAYEYARSVDAGDTVVVGVNRFVADNETDLPMLQIDPELEQNQVRSLRARRAARNEASVRSALDQVTAAARGTDNLLYPMKEALILGATIGEVTKALLPVFGRYQAR
ncbi:Methylmalonyl-CoA mutase [hydrothermal vent metagenome]|uniref:Methylmalonyl-CoA mutase n=1 Tax=hydrothermal vent metagenome TaxID=652676 RepID=A0A3B0SJ02_9ZZZZ